MNLLRSFLFWAYMAAICFAGSAVLVVSASGAITELHHLRACSVGVKSTCTLLLPQPLGPAPGSSARVS